MQKTICNEGELGSTLGFGKSPGEGNGNPLQHSCPGNPMDRGAWQATVHGVAGAGQDLETKPPNPQGNEEVARQSLWVVPALLPARRVA